MIDELNSDIIVGIDGITVKDIDGIDITISNETIMELVLIMNYEEILRQATLTLEKRNDNS